jgi:hypothetical protein
MTHPIYIIDRCGQYREESYLTQEEKSLAYDRWDALGCDIYTDRVDALVAHNQFNRSTT